MSKILLLHVAQNFGGLEKRFYSYGKHLLASNEHHYTVVFSRSLLKISNEEIKCKAGNKLIKYGFPWTVKNKLTRYLDYLSLLPILLSMYLLRRYDAAHFTTTATIFLSRFVRARRKVYSVVISEKRGLEKAVHAKGFMQIMNSGYRIDCLDRNIREAILARFPAMADQVYCAPCSFINYDDLDTEVVTKKKMICFAGRFEEFKGADLLMKAIPEIAKQTDYDIAILGFGRYELPLKDIVNSYNLQDRVKILYTKDPKSYLKRSRIFLSLQRDENYPSQSLIEAMACKNVIIATNVGLTSDIVRDEFGVLIKNDPHALLEALLKLANQEEKLSDMGERARSFAVKNHNIDRFHQYLLGVYC